MATLRIRFKLNPGREGIALGKLSKQAENMELFLRSLASDLGAEDLPNFWVASKFANGSMFSTAEYQAVVDVDTAVRFNESVIALSKYAPIKKPIPTFVSPATIEKFSNLRQGLDADELIGLGVFDIQTGKIRWNYINRLHLEEVVKSIETETVYIGAIMGRTHEWNKGADRPYLIIRELTSGDLVKCSYDDRDYDKVAKLFSKKTAVVIIQGVVTLNRITMKSELTKAEQFDFAPEFSNQDFDRFFGCAPGMTGNMSAAEFIAQGRSDE